MKKLFLLLMLVSQFSAEAERYYPIGQYSALAYRLLLEYVGNNPDASSRDVKKYLRNKAFEVIMNDAKNMGYDRHSVIRCTYCFAIIQDDQNEKILQALKEEMETYHLLRNIAFYGGLGFSIFSTICVFPLLYVTGRMYREFLRS